MSDEDRVLNKKSEKERGYDFVVFLTSKTFCRTSKITMLAGITPELLNCLQPECKSEHGKHSNRHGIRRNPDGGHKTIPR